MVFMYLHRACAQIPAAWNRLAMECARWATNNSRAADLDGKGVTNVAEDNTGPAVQPGMVFPCSLQQQQFWVLDRVMPGDPALNVAVRWQLDGHVSAETMEQTFQLIMARHEVLRTFFIERDGEPFQSVLDRPPPLRIAEVDLTGLSAADRAAQVLRISKLTAAAPFDLASPALLRATLLRLEPTRYILLVTAHHIVCDGWSIGVLAREVGTIYRALRERQPHGLAELPLQCGDFAQWQHAMADSGALAPHARYWGDKLSGMRHFEVTPDRPRPAQQTSNGHIVSLLLPKPLSGRIHALGARHGATLFATALAALKALLHRVTGETDIGIGTQVAGRDDTMLEPMVGVFINTLVLRDQVAGDMLFTDLLGRVRDTVAEALAHAQMPIQQLVELLKPPRDPSRNPLFSVNFIFQRSFIANADYGDWTLTDIPSVTPGAIYDLNFFMVERPDGWRLSCEYNTDLFEQATVEALLARMQVVLTGIADDPERPLSALPVMIEEERQRVLVAWNDTAAPFPAEATVATLWDEQVARTPTAPAVLWGGSSLGYAELDAMANRLARRLAARGVGPRTVVGIALRRSPEMVAALLGVWKAGAASLPLDPDFPASRLLFMARDAGLAVVVTSGALETALPLGLPCLLLDGQAAPEAEPRGASAEDLAYVVYTSGSTGQPKGVANTHRGLINRLAWLWQAQPYGSGDVAVHKTSPNFVDAVTELLGPLLRGVPVLVAAPEDALDPERLGGLIHLHRATRLTLVPSLLEALLDCRADLSSLRLVVCSGEVLPRSLADRLHAAFPATRLMNFYGSSEANGDSLAVVVEPGEGRVPIGRPIANTTAYILDATLQPLPQGAPGMLYIGGEGLAAGYLNRPDLTAERFLSNPFGPGRLYRTGDIARWRPDGLLDYFGRADHQVKLRGFRIELGEVEAALHRHPAVAEAVVTADTDAGVLYGYVVARASAAAAAPGLVRELRQVLEGSLPAYMRPAGLTVLERLPRTTTGKVDRAALPAQVRAPSAPGAAALGDATEQCIAAIWRDVLGVMPGSAEDNFFDLGGHSLRAVRMLARLESAFGFRIGIAALFRAPTIRELAALVRAPTPGAADYQIVQVQPAGTRTPLIAINNTGLFAPLTRRLGTDQPFFAVQLFDPGAPQDLPPRRFDDLALEQLRIIQQFRPHGPYVLIGLCVAGCLAYEVAQLLTARDEQVELLVMIDSWAPGYRRRLPRWQRPLAEFSYRWQSLAAEVAERHGAKAKLAYLGRRVGEKLGIVTPPPVTDGAPWYQAPLVAAANGHMAQPYAGRVLLLYRPEQPHGWFLDPHLGWSGLLRGPHEVHEVPGTHVGMFQEPHVGVIAGYIHRMLAGTSGGTEPCLPIDGMPATQRTAPENN
jgi:amino acid adenylation domain-containing protein